MSVPDAPTITSLINGHYYIEVAIASDNLHMAAVEVDQSGGNNKIAISTDGGVSWTSSPGPNAGNVINVVASSDGEIVYMVEEYSYFVYRSADYGDTFTQLTNAPVGSYRVACSSNGVYVFIYTNTGSIYVSSDSGANFTENYTGLVNLGYSIICSATGQYVYSCTDANPTTVAISNNYGASFTTSSFDGYVNRIICDQTGQYLFASGNDGVYRSVDYGATWNMTSLTGYSRDIANNAAGNRAVVFHVDDDKYYRTIDAGLTWSPITLVGSTIGGEPIRFGSSINHDGSTYILSAYNPGTYFVTDNSIDAPIFTSALVVNNTTIAIEFALFYNGGSALTDVQYARSANGYTTWTSLGLTGTLEGQTTATITGLVSNPYGSYKLRAVNVNGNSLPSTAQVAYVLKSGEYYPKVVFSSNNQYAIAQKFNDGGVDQVAVSSDSGVTWTAITPPGSANCIDVAMSLDGTHMYYTTNDGVYHSTNYGVGFSQLLNAPLPVVTIACDSTGQKVYCPSDITAEIYVSTNAGADFTLATNIGVRATSMICSANGVYVYMYYENQVYVSSNSGSTFTPAASLTQIISYIVCDQSGERVYVSTDGGVLCSVDYGASFVLTSHPDVACYNVAIDSLGNRIVALAVDGTTRVSYDAGTTWTVQTIPGQSLTFTSGGVSISPDGTRYAYSIGAPGAYFKSEGTADVAPIWTVINTPYYYGSISTNNQRIIALQYDNNLELYNVWYSSNAGVDWTQSQTTNFGFIYGLYASASGQVVLALMSVGAPYLSINYGETFTITTFELVGTEYPNGLSVMNSTGTSMMAIASDGYVYRSVDSGVTWTNPYQFSNEYTINGLCASASMDRIYAIVVVQDIYYIYVSTDMGNSWISASVNPSSITNINAIACDWSGQNLVLSAFGDGIYRSTNGGVSWTHLAYPTGGYAGSIFSNSTGNRIISTDYGFFRVSVDAGTTWSTLSTPDTNATYANFGALSPDGSFVMSASDFNTYFQTLGAADLPVVPCFLEGSKILCQVGGAEQYVAVETILSLIHI